MEPFFYITCFVKSTELLHVCGNPFKVFFANDFTHFTVFGCIILTISAIIAKADFCNHLQAGDISISLASITYHP